MLRLSTVFGIIGAASILTVAGHPLAKRSFEAIASTDTVHTAPVVKGDRLMTHQSGSAAKVVPASIEIIGSEPMNLVMRARDGSVVYSVDGATGTTSIARNGELPAVTIKAGETPAPMAVPTSGPTAQESPVPTSPRPTRAIRVGCEGAVSSLVSAEARRMLPGRCLV